MEDYDRALDGYQPIIRLSRESGNLIAEITILAAGLPACAAARTCLLFRFEPASPVSKIWPRTLPWEPKYRALDDRRDVYHLAECHVRAAYATCLAAVLPGVFF